MNIELLKKRIKNLCVTLEEFDEFIPTQSHVIRSIRGHCFEIWFDRAMERIGYKTETIGGDDTVDRRLNGHTLQLKTPFLNGTIENKIVRFKMHKTHGAERKPLCFYSKKEFADFFVGMHPKDGLIICPREFLPTRGEVQPKLDYPEYLADPMPFAWDTKWLNRYDLLGLGKIEKYPLWSTDVFKATLFPKIARAVGFGDEELIAALTGTENFRIWDQLIVGTIREVHFFRFAGRLGIKLSIPKGFGGRGNNKIDFVTQSGKKIQVKGLTKKLCKGPVLACEIKGSHSRIPTRLYRREDFDAIVIVIDPGMIPPDIGGKLGVDTAVYNFAIFSVGELPLHKRSSEWGGKYIKDIFKFDVRTTVLNNTKDLKSW